AATPLHVSVNGDRVVLDPVHFSTDGGDLHAQGRLDGQTIQGAVDGHLDLELLQPFLRGTLDQISGDLKVEVKAAGTLSEPDLRGQVLVVNPVKVRLTALPSDVLISSGQLSFDAGQVSMQNLAVTVEGATMRL